MNPHRDFVGITEDKVILLPYVVNVSLLRVINSNIESQCCVSVYNFGKVSYRALYAQNPTLSDPVGADRLQPIIER